MFHALILYCWYTTEWRRQYGVGMDPVLDDKTEEFRRFDRTIDPEWLSWWYQSQSHVTTDGQSVHPSGCSDTLRAHDQILLCVLAVMVLSLEIVLSEEKKICLLLKICSCQLYNVYTLQAYITHDLSGVKILRRRQPYMYTLFTVLHIT
jgi:hypothetical protein